ncbi:MAG: tRNA pseudouridine(55) synthase TruB [Clostridia bacterium]|nr:tRNA pseudouridine(55) synthase TruB [Clostridia bacterium]
MARKKDSPVSGVIVIDKHEGVTSFRIISILRRLFDTSQVGHTGTLDPLATGVLPVLIGRAVKASEYIMSQDKCYTAELKLGVETDTEDTTGEILRVCDSIPCEDEVRRCIASFTGEIMQVPPMYSAIKVDGRKLVDIAREGGEVERKPRAVAIHSIETEMLSHDTYRLHVSCSKGTYIRTLCADIGKKLGCGAAMSALRRTETGNFTLADAYSIEQLEGMTVEKRRALVMPAESLFTQLEAVALPQFYANLFISGAPLYQKKLRVSIPFGECVRVKHGEEFLGLGRSDTLSDGTPVLKAEKLFRLEKV